MASKKPRAASGKAGASLEKAGSALLKTLPAAPDAKAKKAAQQILKTARDAGYVVNFQLQEIPTETVSGAAAARPRPTCICICICSLNL